MSDDPNSTKDAKKQAKAEAKSAKKQAKAEQLAAVARAQATAPPPANTNTNTNATTPPDAQPDGLSAAERSARAAEQKVALERWRTAFGALGVLAALVTLLWTLRNGCA